MTLAVAFVLPVTAQAHALMVSSSPSAGSDLSQIPGAVTVRFSEAPEVSQSSIVVQMTMGGSPMMFGVPLANGWKLQAYLAPGHPGRNTLHLVFMDQRQGPVVVAATPVVTARQGGTQLAPRMLRVATTTPYPNHFYGVGRFTTGRWDFQMTVAAPDGRRLKARFSLTVAK